MKILPAEEDVSYRLLGLAASAACACYPVNFPPKQEHPKADLADTHLPRQRAKLLR